MARKNKPGFFVGATVGFIAGVAVTAGTLNHENPEHEPTPRNTSPADTIAVGKFVVDSVIDGDTIKVKDPKAPKGVATIRILGINAPELHPNQGRPVQCYGSEAFTEAKRMLLHKTVELSTDPEADTQDEHSRSLRMVDTDPGKGVDNFSKHMVQGGYAAAYRGYVTSIRKELIDLEKDARNHDRGMWDACNIPLSAVPTNLSSEVKFPPAK